MATQNHLPVISHRRMLVRVQWEHFKAALMMSVGFAFITFAALIAAVTAQLKPEPGLGAGALALIFLVLLVTTIWHLVRGIIDVIRLARKSPDYISRFYAAL